MAKFVYIRDTEGDETIPLSKVPDLPIIGRGSRGKRVAPSTIYRWASRGCRGIQLEVLRVGGALKTTEAAVRRFTERLSKGDFEDAPKVNAHTHPADEAELDRANI